MSRLPAHLQPPPGSTAAAGEALRSMRERILVLDGAMGTLHPGRRTSRPRTSAAPELEGCNENLVLTRPDVIRDDPRGLLRRRRAT